MITRLVKVSEEEAIFDYSMSVPFKGMGMAVYFENFSKKKGTL